MSLRRSRALLLVGGLFFAFMLCLTLLGLDTPVNRMVFSGTSGEYMMTIVSGSALAQSVLLLGTGYGLYRMARQPTRGWISLVIAMTLVWCLSGRKVGVLLWPEGRVYVGWFMMQTEQFALCAPVGDCETTTRHTLVTPLPFWRVRLANAHSQHVVFIGPVNWVPTLRMLRQAFDPLAKE